MRIRPHSIGFRALKNVRLRFFGISTTRYKIHDGPIGSENPEASERNHFWTSEVEKMKEKEVSESFEKAVVDYGSKLDSEENLLKQFMSKAYRTEMEAFLADSGTFLSFLYLRSQPRIHKPIDPKISKFDWSSPVRDFEIVVFPVRDFANFSAPNPVRCWSTDP